MGQELSRNISRSRGVRGSLAVGALLITVAGGCGSDAEDSLTEQGFRDRSNEICAEGIEEIGEALGAAFGAGDPTPEQLASAHETLVSTSRRIVDDLDALEPPDSMRDDVEAILAEFRTANDVAESQGIGFFEGDDDPWEKGNEMARAMGLDVCAE